MYSLTSAVSFPWPKSYMLKISTVGFKDRDPVFFKYSHKYENRVQVLQIRELPGQTPPKNTSVEQEVMMPNPLNIFRVIPFKHSMRPDLP